MDPVTVGALSVAMVSVMILLGFQIGVALSATSFVGVYLVTGHRLNVAISLLGSTSYNAIADYVFAVIPLFVLMGLLTMASGATTELFDSARSLSGRMRGGVGIATVAANAIFAAVTGVSVASAAVFSRLAVPEMRRLDYDHRFALGIVASSALLGMLIPPSVLMIIYALLTDQSIGALFAAGVLPGLLIAGALAACIWGLVVLRPGLDGGGKEKPVADGSSRLKTILRPWAIYLLIVVALGGIYGGFFTPTEAGAIGAAGAFLIYLFRGHFTWRGFGEIVLETGRSTASIFFLFIAASMYSRMLALTGLPDAIAHWVAALNLAPIAVIFAFVLALIVMGCFIDSVSILLLAIPIMAPVVASLNFDLVWFGIVAIVAVEIGLLTPPFGMVVFVMKASLPYEVDVGDIYRGSFPFFCVLIAALLVLILVPGISTWLPGVIF